VSKRGRERKSTAKTSRTKKRGKVSSGKKKETRTPRTNYRNRGGNPGLSKTVKKKGLTLGTFLPRKG